MNAKRAVLYYRVSKDEQNCDNQMADLHNYCEFRKWLVAKEYRDDAISGTKKSRPELDFMMREIRHGKYDVLLVWSYDRFARNALHLVTTLDELKNLGVDFASYKQQIDTTTSIGQMMFTLFAGIAQLERDMISERTKASLARLKASGVRLGRPVEGDAGKLSMVSIMRKDGYSIRRIAKDVEMSPAWVHKVLKGAA
jgi:DNA invertase Pin-like site-specific DNA recombinase